MLKHSYFLIFSYDQVYHSPLSEELEIRHIGNRAKTHLDLSYSVAVIEVQVSYLDSVNRKGQRR